MQGQDVEGLVQNVLSRADEAEAMYRTLVDLVPAITYVEALDTANVLGQPPDRVDPRIHAGGVAR